MLWRASFLVDTGSKLINFPKANLRNTKVGTRLGDTGADGTWPGIRTCLSYSRVMRVSIRSLGPEGMSGLIAAVPGIAG